MSMRKLRLLVLVLTISVSVLSSCAQAQNDGTKTIKTLTEENFMTLLTVEEVQGVLISEASLETVFYDYRKILKSIDPEQVVDMDSFYGLSFQAEDMSQRSYVNVMKSMKLMVVDYRSQASAQQHFEEVIARAEEPSFMEPPLGEASAKIEVNADGIGDIVVFIKGDKMVQLHTAHPNTEQPLISLEGLLQLAQTVEEKLP